MQNFSSKGNRDFGTRFETVTITVLVATTMHSYQPSKGTASPLPQGGGGDTWVSFLLGMCRWPLRTPVPLESILWLIIDSISIAIPT